MLNLLKEIINLVKEDPAETLGSLFTICLIFGMFYVSMWIFY